MHTLDFALSSEGVTRFYDVLLCLAKFGELVSLEARRDSLTLTALNSSKSAYASFRFESNLFFEKYSYNGGRVPIQRGKEGSEARFTCQLYNKALLSIFRGRLQDRRDADTAVERCEVFVQDQADKTECRLVVKMICRHGVIKTYKLTYESVEVMQALFDKNAAKNRWKIGADVLRTFSEYFGVGTEQLEISPENGRVAFTSYTEKVVSDQEVLKQPLHTSIAIDALDFEEFAVEDKLRIGISVKDFRAIVTHAETLKTSIQAYYSIPSRPMQLTYPGPGMQCDCTLMTLGDSRSRSVAPGRMASVAASERLLSRQSSRMPPSLMSRQPSTQTELQHEQAPTDMPPPAGPASRSFGSDISGQRVQKPSPPPPRASLDPNSLFLPSEADEDERKWGERDYEEEEDTLGWNANADADHFSQSFHNLRQDQEISSRADTGPEQRVPPTQKIRDINSIFEFD